MTERTEASNSEWELVRRRGSEYCLRWRVGPPDRREHASLVGFDDAVGRAAELGLDPAPTGSQKFVRALLRARYDEPADPGDHELVTELDALEAFLAAFADAPEVCRAVVTSAVRRGAIRQVDIAAAAGLRRNTIAVNADRDPAGAWTIVEEWMADHPDWWETAGVEPRVGPHVPPERETLATIRTERSPRDVCLYPGAERCGQTHTYQKHRCSGEACRAANAGAVALARKRRGMASRRTVDWPDEDDLRRMVAETSKAEVARTLGCSATAVAKRLELHAS